MSQTNNKQNKIPIKLGFSVSTNVEQLVYIILKPSTYCTISTIHYYKSKKNVNTGVVAQVCQWLLGDRSSGLLEPRSSRPAREILKTLVVSA